MLQVAEGHGDSGGHRHVAHDPRRAWGQQHTPRTHAGGRCRAIGANGGHGAICVGCIQHVGHAAILSQHAPPASETRPLTPAMCRHRSDKQHAQEKSPAYGTHGDRGGVTLTC